MSVETQHSLRSLDRSLPIALLRARESLMRRFRPLLAEHGLTEQQWRVLRVLDDAGESLSVGQIAERAVLLGPSLSRILATLEGRGCLQRRNHSSDARRVEIALTTKGQRLVAKIAPRSELAYGEIESELGTDEIRRLEVALERIAHIL